MKTSRKYNCNRSRLSSKVETANGYCRFNRLMVLEKGYA